MKKISLLLCFFLVTVFFYGCSISKRQSIAKNLCEYDITAVYDDQTKTISASQTVLYINSSEDVLTDIVFNLAPNGYREGATYCAVAVEETNRAYPNGISYGKIDIIAAKVQNKTAEFKVGGEDKNSLIIKFHDSLFPNEKVSIYIEYKVSLANVKHRLGYTENAVNLGNWYPTIAVYENFQYVSNPYYSKGDPFYYQMANYKVQFSADSKFKVAASGNLCDKSVRDGIATYLYEENAIRDFALVLSDKFSVVHGNFSNTTISYYYIEDENPAKSLGVAKDSIAFFSQKFGAYDYKNLSVVQTDFLQGGMEFSNLVYISGDLKGNAYEQVIVHEIAHQWWYMMVGSNQVNEAWLDEGLTEFSTAYYFESKGDESLLSSGERGYKGYLQLFSSFGSPIDTNMQKNLANFTSITEYVAMSYSKGHMLFSGLRRDVGEDKFIKGIKQYFSDNKYLIANKGKFISSFSKGSRRNIEGYVEGFLTARIFI